MKKIYCVCLSAMVLLGACKKNNNDPQPSGTTTPTNKVKVGDSYAAGAGIKVTLWQDSAFAVGYNHFYITLADSATGNAITDAGVDVDNVYNATSINTHTPIEQPAYNSTTALYTGATVFTWPSNVTNGAWNIQVTVQRANSTTIGSTNFQPQVKDHRGALTTQVGTDSQTYIITTVQPTKPQIGINNLEVLIAKRTMLGNDYTYVPVNNLTIQFSPQMPSMQGMTTSNNQNPASIGNGHYTGKVNFTMTGDWELDFMLLQSSTTIVSNAALTITF